MIKLRFLYKRLKDEDEDQDERLKREKKAIIDFQG